MNKNSRAIQDLSKPPLPGDIFQLGQNKYITVISLVDGTINYALGAHDISMSGDAPKELTRDAIAIPDRIFRKWLATIAAGHRVDTPPPR